MSEKRNQLEVIVEQQQGLIEFNYEELKENVLVAMKPYQNLVVTEDSISEGKKLRAKLNGLVKQIDDKRKEIKKEYSTPLTIFENQVKDILSVVKEGSTNIDVQVKEFERQQEELKRQEIEDYFKSKDIMHFGFEVVYDERYLLKQYTEDKWKKEIDSKLQQIENDIKFLTDLNLEYIGYAIENYLSNGLDVQNAKYKHDQFVKSVKQANDLKTEIKAKESIELENNSSNIKDTYTTSFQVIDVTMEDLLAIEELFVSRNIKFRKVVL